MKLSPRDALKDKHPACRKFFELAFIPLAQDLSDTEFHPVMFESLNSDCIRLNSDALSFGAAGCSVAVALH